MTKVILITGGSRGIGAATAELAATRGYSVCIAYRQNKEQADAVIGRVHECGQQGLAVATDVASETEVNALFETIESEYGRLDGLVNNAGILETQSRVENISAERLRRVLDINVVGSFNCARQAIQRMSTRLNGSGGAIVNVSSAAARSGSPYEYVDYAMSKGALDTFTIGLAKEVAEEGIRVNAVRPGFIHTDIHAAGGEPNRIERLSGAIPLKRGGHPLEVAHAILWLLSEEASYCTGGLIDVAGGI